MKKTLITALIIVSLLLAAAAGVIVYMESRPDATPVESTPGTSESIPADTQQEENTTASEQPTEETVGISLPTEDPDEVGPEYTWPEDETGTAETAAPGDPDATWDPDENETPTMGV